MNMKKFLLLLTLTATFYAASAQDYILKNTVNQFSIMKSGQGISILGNDIIDANGVYFLKANAGHLPNDSTLVHIAGTETITGAKNFTGLPSFLNFNLNGSSSGTISFMPQPASGTYNFNLPATAGTAGQALISGAGGTNPMTWATPLLASKNLSDLTNIDTAIANLGINAVKKLAR